MRTNFSGFLRPVLGLCLLIACGGVTPPVTPVILGSRVGAAMAYDEARKQTILFGGTGPEAGTPRADRNSTWTWDGTTWARIATTGPTPRFSASMVYDATRQRVVLYGGQTGVFPGVTVLTDTWEWDGTAWTKRADGGPPRGVHQSLSFDRARGRTILYGGFDPATGTEYRDLWEWDGTVWTKAGASQAPNVTAVGIAYDEKQSVTLLFSTEGSPGTPVFDSYNGTVITRIAAAPPCSPASTVSLGPTRGGVLMYAPSCGSGGQPQSWIWNGTTWALLSTQPTRRYQAAMAYDRQRDRVVLYGGGVGEGTPDFEDTWEFDGTQWVKR